LNNDPTLLDTQEGATRGKLHAWSTDWLRRQVMCPGDPLRTPYGLLLSS